MNEHEIEPVPGLPERLPQGEHILWQGAPDWKALALRALQVRTVAFYFAVLFVWSVWASISEGATVAAALLNGLRLVPVALAAIALLAGFSWLVTRTTVYTITNRRIVMRFGVALPMTLNLPYAVVGSAALKLYRGGNGDIPLGVNGERVSYIALWPHVRPWWTKNPQPMLRCVPDAERVAAILSQALRKAGGDGVVPADFEEINTQPQRHHAEPQAA